MEENKEKKSGHYFLIFYWNPRDKRIFVPKRYGIGWTLNFANPFSILMFAAILIITAVLANLL